MSIGAANVNRELGGQALALTFDDGPDGRWTPLVLEALAAVDARATFFVTPRLGVGMVGRIAAAGHEVGYHCDIHVRHSDRTRLEVCEGANTDLLLLAAMGLDVRAWRPPWGVLADWTPGLAAELGLELWLWSCDTEDWRGRPAEQMLAELSENLRPGSVVLMHDGIGPGALRVDAGETVALVVPLVELIRSRGLEVATVAAGSPRTAKPVGAID
jgi:peptidoglycan/xylan/chitin deacetylase (PgdA/CDA1 family)